MKYPRTYHLSNSPGATNDDRIAKSLDHLINTPIVITEKFDGENCAITNKGVYTRSHAEFTTSPWSLKVRQLHSIIGQSLPEMDYFLFGENMQGVHSIEYTKLTSPFYLFAIREKMKWSSWKEVEETAFLLDIPHVPVLFKGIVNDKTELETMIDRFMKNGSKLGNDIEGVVVRTQDGFTDDDFSKKVQKFVRKDHVQTDEHWTKNWKNAKINQTY